MGQKPLHACPSTLPAAATPTAAMHAAAANKKPKEDNSRANAQLVWLPAEGGERRIPEAGHLRLVHVAHIGVEVLLQVGLDTPGGGALPEASSRHGVQRADRAPDGGVAQRPELGRQGPPVLAGHGADGVQAPRERFTRRQAQDPHGGQVYWVGQPWIRLLGGDPGPIALW